MFKCTSAAHRPWAPVPFQQLPSVPSGGTGTCSGSLGMDGNVSKVLVSQAGNSTDAPRHKELGSQCALEQSMVLAVKGRNGACMEGPVHLVLQHLVTAVQKGTGQEVSLAGRAWSGQEHISRARCPISVPAFIRRSVSHATTALSAAVFPASGFPYKAVAFLAAVPSASLQEPE